MLYVNFEEIDIPDTWIARAAVKLENLMARENKSNINFSSAFWGELRDNFNIIHDGQCWYCENRISGAVPEIEHFRPKQGLDGCDGHNGYWWLAYECTNYRLSCSICNNRAHKGNKFPLVDERQRAFENSGNYEDYRAEQPKLLDPFIQEDCESLACNIYEYKMMAKDGENKDRAQESIKVFGLDKSTHIRDCGRVLQLLQSHLSIPDEESRLIAIRGLVNSAPGYSSFVSAFLEENNIDLTFEET